MKPLILYVLTLLPITYLPWWWWQQVHLKYQHLQNYMTSPNTTVKWEAFLLHIQQVLHTNQRLKIGYPRFTTN